MAAFKYLMKETASGQVSARTMSEDDDDLDKDMLGKQVNMY